MASRIRITNLPKQITVRKLKEHFGVCGEITDTGILKTKDARGLPRMAFVGFKDPEAAAEAVSRLDGTFLFTAKLNVQLATEAAQPLPEPEIAPKAAAAVPQPVATAKDKLEGLKTDPRFLEFMTVAQRNEAATWINEMPQNAPQFVDAPPTEDLSTADGQKASEEPPAPDPTPEEFAAKQQRLNAISDLDFLKSLKAGAAAQEAEPQEGPPPAEEPSTTPAVGRLYIANLAFTTTEEDLEQELKKYGSVQSVHIPLSRESRQSKGVAFAQFATAEEAIAAKAALNRASFQGRILMVKGAMAQPAPVELQWSESYKTKKALKDKKERENAKRWSSLYISSNTVVETIAKRLNVDKDAIVGPDQENAAARVAIAESLLTSEVSQLLTDEGIDLTALADRKQRQNSRTTILVKNLPASTGEKNKSDILNDLIKLFRTAGDIGRVAAPNGTTIVLIDFLDAVDARRAFAKFAYHKFNNMPLYLEWAPVGVLPSKKAAVNLEGEAQLDNDDAMTLYVANLPFTVKEQELKTALFPRQANAIRSISIKAAKGFAFVEFKDHPSAAKAYKEAQGVEMEGRSLSISFAKPKQSAIAVDSKHECPPECNPLKLVIRNVPFEATASDLRNLFGAHSQVKSVRLPKKQDEYDPLTGTKKPTRGFAFVEFLTQDEALRAMQTCNATHLYGRHLVLEWARDNTSVDALREKAKRKSLAEVPSDSRMTTKKLRKLEQTFA
jgi:multiple RNA-binding domain-containing protein 1